MDVGRRDLIMECPNVMLTRKRERNSDICANRSVVVCSLLGTIQLISRVRSVILLILFRT